MRRLTFCQTHRFRHKPFEYEIGLEQGDDSYLFSLSAIIDRIRRFLPFYIALEGSYNVLLLRCFSRVELPRPTTAESGLGFWFRWIYEIESSTKTSVQSC